MMRRLIVCLSACLLYGCAADVPPATQMVMGGSPVGTYSLNMQSMVDARFVSVVRQQYDFSCGSAALATLLRFHYGYDVREQSAFLGMWAKGDQAQIRQVGFSLLDMKRWLASRGLSADGYSVDLDQVAKTGVPGIALISIKNYRHFVVVKGVRTQEVLLGDPSIGLRVMPRNAFEEAWNGIYFVISEEQERARQRFDQDEQWAGYVRSPLGSGFSDPVSQQALLLTAPFYGDIS